jgi:hypothetical protein
MLKSYAENVAHYKSGTIPSKPTCLSLQASMAGEINCHRSAFCNKVYNCSHSFLFQTVQVNMNFSYIIALVMLPMIKATNG